MLQEKDIVKLKIQSEYVRNLNVSPDMVLSNYRIRTIKRYDFEGNDISEKADSRLFVKTVYTLEEVARRENTIVIDSSEIPPLDGFPLILVSKSIESDNVCEQMFSDYLFMYQAVNEIQLKKILERFHIPFNYPLTNKEKIGEETEAALSEFLDEPGYNVQEPYIHGHEVGYTCFSRWSSGFITINLIGCTSRDFESGAVFELFIDLR